MKLWLLRPVPNLQGNDEDGGNPWCPWYEKVFAMVVRAESEDAARTLTSLKAEDEGTHAWLDQTLSTCEELTAEGPAEVILRHYRES